MLRRLSASVYFEDQRTLEAFINNHAPLLEELEVSVKKKLSLSLYIGIRDGCVNLRKFHVTAKYLVTLAGDEGIVNKNGDFGAMTRLKDFQFARPYDDSSSNRAIYGSGVEFLRFIASNEQLERLSFKGVGNRRYERYGFWNTRRRGRNGQQTNFEVQLEMKLELIRGLRNLKRLSFIRCKNAVDDRVMQFILRELTKLEELEVSHCEGLTDVGIGGTGIHKEGSAAGGSSSAVSFGNLKGKICTEKVFQSLEISSNKIVCLKYLQD